jgi:type I restriction enzyme R subunit
MTEDQLEQEALAWLQDVGYSHRYGPDIAHDSPTPERQLMPSSARHCE